MKILENKLFLALILFPFIRPDFLSYIETTNFIVDNIWRIISIGIIFIMYVQYNKISKLVIAYFVFCLWLLVSTIINSGDYLGFLKFTLTVLSILILTEMSINTNPYSFIKFLAYYLALIALIGFVILLMFPEGLLRDSYYSNSIHFLGHRNSLIRFLLPTMVVTVIYSDISIGKISNYVAVVFLFVSASMILTWSATGLIGWFMMLIFIVFVYNKNWGSILNFKALFFISAIVFLMIVVFRLQEFFSVIIEDVLHRKLTLTGRTIIWDQYIELFKQSPILGYGFYEDKGLVLYYDKLMYTHNSILQILIQGGALALIAFLSIYIICGQKLMHSQKHRYSMLLSMFIFCLLIMGITEDHTRNNLTYILLAMSYHVDKIIAQSESFLAEKLLSSVQSSRYIKGKISKAAIKNSY